MLPNDDAYRFALELADTLGERAGSQGHKTMLRAARVLGLPALRVAARETLRLIDAGGLSTLDKTRPRTAGGIFLRLIREACDDETRRRIFGKRLDAPGAYQSSAAFRERFAAACGRAEEVSSHASV